MYSDAYFCLFTLNKEFQPEFKHHNYIEMEAFLKKVADEHPAITNLYSIGQSVQGRELYVLEISDNPGRHEPGWFHKHTNNTLKEGFGVQHHV